MKVRSVILAIAFWLFGGNLDLGWMERLWWRNTESRLGFVP